MSRIELEGFTTTYLDGSGATCVLSIAAEGDSHLLLNLIARPPSERPIATILHATMPPLMYKAAPESFPVNVMHILFPQGRSSPHCPPGAEWNRVSDELLNWVVAVAAECRRERSTKCGDAAATSSPTAAHAADRAARA